jgi:hypothetical protein
MITAEPPLRYFSGPHLELTGRQAARPAGTLTRVGTCDRIRPQSLRDEVGRRAIYPRPFKYERTSCFGQLGTMNCAIARARSFGQPYG